MPKTNQEILVSNQSKDIPKTDIHIIIKRRNGRGKESKYVFHDFATGESYDSVEDAVKGKKCKLITKQPGIKSGYDDKLGAFVERTTLSDLRGVYYSVVEHEGVKFLCVMICTFNIRATLSSPDEKRTWEFISKFYVDENKKVYESKDFSWGNYYDEYIEETYKDLLPRENWFNLVNINYLPKNNPFYYASHDDNMLSVMNEMGWGVVTLGANKRIMLNAGYSLASFLKYNEPSKRSGPKQNHIDELVSYELEDVVASKFNYKRPTDNYDVARLLETYDFANISSVKGIETPICCYRTFSRFEDGSYSEGARIYIEGNGKFSACKRTNLGDWVRMSLSCNASDFDYKVSYVNKKTCEGTILEYLIPMLGSHRKKGVGQIIATTLRHPCLEKLYKSGLKDFIDTHASESYSKIWDSLVDTIGGINEKGKTVYSILGINKNQLTLLESKIENALATETLKPSIKNDTVYYFIGRMKKCFSITNMSDIDIDTFKDMLDTILSIEEFENNIIENGYTDSQGNQHYSIRSRYENRNSNYRTEIADERGKFLYLLEQLSSLYPLTTVRSLLPKILDLYKVLKETESVYPLWNGKGFDDQDCISINRPIELYCSYIDMVEELQSFEELQNRRMPSSQFRNEEDIRMMHDDVLQVYNYYMEEKRQRELNERYSRDYIRGQREIERNEKKWNAIKRQWDKWLYNNNEYSIVIPEEPFDLVTEGSTLGHCVGSYIRKVVNRSTNIVFIRRNEDTEKPLFTVEILSDGTVEQIHGMYNCTIDDEEVLKKEPNIINFVRDWAKEKELKLHNINKVR